MKCRLALVALFAITLACFVPAVFAQSTSVRGACKDLEGKPIAGATVRWLNTSTGQKREIKTNNKGEYYSLGISSGKYTVTLLGADGNELFHLNGITVGLDEIVLDLDLKKEQLAAAKGQGMSEEELKRRQAEQAKQEKEAQTIKGLNDKLVLADQSMKASDYDAAIQTLNEANQLDATHDLIWFKLGEACRASAAKQTDSAEKTKRYDQAIEAYNKAIAIKPDGAYFNNLADAYAKEGKTEDAVKTYNQAAQIDPAAAGQYYFNLGAILTNANIKGDAAMRKAAVEAFDKAITADPNRADAYYWKATSLMGDATLQGEKMIAPPGTAEAFNKYLELQPTGSHAEEAKQMLALMGATIQTHYGKGKVPKK